MVEIQEVKTKKQQREFLRFPLKLYRDNPNFVPPLWLDEKKIFDPHYGYYETCKAVYYNAYRGSTMVGRISGILQKQSNELRQEKRVRFTRFDCINDQEVANALFAAVERWAIEQGMDTICGPLGFSNLERQGLLVEGFDELSTFEEQYNASYYASLIENCGYHKEIDWVERQLRLPETHREKLIRFADKVEKHYHLKDCRIKDMDTLLKKYGDSFFQLMADNYSHLYQTVPIDGAARKSLIQNFKLLVNVKYVSIIVNEDDEAVGMAIAFPSIAKALQKSQGRLTPAALFRVLRSARHPRILELGLIGVDPAYRKQGAAIVILAKLAKELEKNPGIEFLETNLNMETNTEIQALWDNRFDARMHKRRRSYIKTLQ